VETNMDDLSLDDQIDLLLKKFGVSEECVIEESAKPMLLTALQSENIKSVSYSKEAGLMIEFEIDV